MFFVVVVAADGVVATFVVAAANAAIPNNVILVDNSMVAISAAMDNDDIIDINNKEDDSILGGGGHQRERPQLIPEELWVDNNSSRDHALRTICAGARAVAPPPMPLVAPATRMLLTTKNPLNFPDNHCYHICPLPICRHHPGGR